MDKNVLYWGIVVICFVASIILCANMDEKLHKMKPDVLPYKWGYFIGWMGLFSYGIVGIIFLLRASNTYGYASDRYADFAIHSIISAISHIFIIKRNKWGSIVGIVMQMNPILWIANGIYLKNRWAEMKGLPFNVEKGVSTHLTK